MKTRQTIEPDSGVQKSQPDNVAATLLGASNTRTCESGNSTESSHESGSREIGDWKIGRLENFDQSTQADALLCSYKPQKSDFSSKNPVNADGEVLAWDAILRLLSTSLSAPVFSTWIAPCHFTSLTNGVLSLAVESEFSRDIIAKRYRPNIEAAAQIVLGVPTKLRLLVDEALAARTQPEAPIATSIPYKQPRFSGEPIQQAELVDDALETLKHPAATEASLQTKPVEPYVSPVINPKYPLARFQNPTNNPKVAMLLEKYGDIRGVMKNHPFFKRIQRPEAEGGWGTDLGGLIYLCKQYTLERVLWAAKQANEYQGVHTSRGATFNHIVRKGLEGVQ